jgi:hypothetical protein
LVSPNSDMPFASLTAREERVLRMRFGIGMNTDHTLEEVDRTFSVTRERIRQIGGGRALQRTSGSASWSEPHYNLPKSIATARARQASSIMA